MGGNDNKTYGFRKDDADALISIIGMGEAETPGRRFGGGSRNVNGIIIMTPTAGIPPRVGTLLGVASCEVYLINGSNELLPSGVSVSVLNMTATPVLGDAYGQAKQVSGRWVIDVEECEVDEPSSSSSSSSSSGSV